MFIYMYLTKSDEIEVRFYLFILDIYSKVSYKLTHQTNIFMYIIVVRTLQFYLILQL